MRWDRAFSLRAERAVKNLEADLELVFESAAERGIDLDVFEQQLLDDLDGEGPIFGKFLNQTLGAVEAGVTTAQQQGETLGAVDLGDLTGDDIRGLLFDDSPEVLDGVVNRATQSGAFTWVAALVNTCPYCLPLHGVTASGEEWTQRGLSPSTIHSDNGINAPCYCRLVPTEAVDESREEMMAPIVRKKVETATGLKGNRRTVRSIAQVDLDKAIAAREKALQTKEGRRTLRLLGKANEDGGED